MNKIAVSRLMREKQKMEQSPNKQILVVANPDNIFEWHFILWNLDDSPYEGGQFHGKLLIPAEYPMKPPTLIFVTPQGRFKQGEKICLSFTSYHPESWSTSWTIESMLVGLMSFMHNNEQTAGGISTSAAEKKRLAKQSKAFNMANPQFVKIFKSHFEQLGLSKEGQIVSNFEEVETTTQNEGTTVESQPAQNYTTMIVIGLILVVVYFLMKKPQYVD